ncbi:MAG: hypothetical protein VKO39_11380, partial [Cyanobacteriota bacterium]|nr:hypothetical protein [Cyanobacteriota bacterium]
LAEGNGLCLLLRRETAALSGHGVHSGLSRRLSDLSTEPGQPQEMHGLKTSLPKANVSSSAKSFPK